MRSASSARCTSRSGRFDSRCSPQSPPAASHRRDEQSHGIPAGPQTLQTGVRRLAGLVLDVKGDFCHNLSRALAGSALGIAWTNLGRGLVLQPPWDPTWTPIRWLTKLPCCSTSYAPKARIRPDNRRAWSWSSSCSCCTSRRTATASRRTCTARSLKRSGKRSGFKLHRRRSGLRVGRSDDAG